MTLLTEKIDAKFITKHSHLKIVANYAVGYDNIDLKAASAAKIKIIHFPVATILKFVKKTTK